MLRRLDRQGWLKLQTMVERRSHGEWLDWFLSNCPTSIGVVIDSDVEFLRDGWLRDLVGVLVGEQAAFVGGEATDERPAATAAEGGVVHSIGRPAAPWLMAFDVKKARALGVGFGTYTHGVDDAGRPYFFDVAARIQWAAAQAGGPVVTMPASYRRKYRHFRGMSWRSEKGLRAPRHYLKLARVHVRTVLRRIDTRPRVTAASQ